MREFDARGCDRQNDLIAYLYDEMSETEQQSFSNHLLTCSACKSQTEGFRAIRQSLTAWRDESLGRVPLPAAANVVREQKASAVAALRAFFSLSPLWMKGAVGFATVLFCILAIFAVSHTRTSPPVAAQNQNIPRSYSPQELNALVEQGVQRELARSQTESSQQATAIDVAIGNKKRRTRSNGQINRDNEVAVNVRNLKAQRPLSRLEREQLAADLRLVSSNERSGEDEQLNQP